MIVLNVSLDGSEGRPPRPPNINPSMYVTIFQRVLQLNCSQPNWSRKLSKDATINKPAWKNTFGSGGGKKKELWCRSGKSHGLFQHDTPCVSRGCNRKSLREEIHK